MRYGTCFLCGKTGWLEEHHVYPGPFRDKSEKYGLKVGLCGESCHRNGRYAAHQCRGTSDALKQFWQIKYMRPTKPALQTSGRHSGRTIWNSTTTMMKGATL